MVKVIEAPFIITPIHTIVGMRSTPQTPRGTDLVNMHTKMLRKVDMIFVGQPLNPRGGGRSRPLGPLGLQRLLRYFGLLMVNLGKPPLPPNVPYCQPFNYLECVKDFDPDVHVRVLKVIIKTKGET
jgi:hypothetical protein